MRRILAALDRQLDALVTFVYGPLSWDGFRVALGARLALLLQFATQVVIGVSAQ